MRKNCGIIVGMSNEKIKHIIEAMTLKAFADEGDQDAGNPSEGETDGDDAGSKKTTINYEDLIAKARKEEKDKHYKTIEKLKGQVTTLTEQHNNDLLVVADLKEKLSKAEEKLTTAGSGDSEEIKTLKKEIETLKNEKDDLDKKVKGFENNKPVSREEVEAEVRAELETEFEVKTYKAEKMAELKNDILVPELVMGTTKEEIDASIQSALERSNEIKKNLGLDSTKPKARTPRTPANPSVSGVQDKEVSLEKLATLDVGSKEYAELRKQLGLK